MKADGNLLPADYSRDEKICKQLPKEAVTFNQQGKRVKVRAQSTCSTPLAHTAVQCAEKDL